jgi:hypothetical protein
MADFRTEEPEPAAGESSQVLRKVFDALTSEEWKETERNN